MNIYACIAPENNNESISKIIGHNHYMIILISCAVPVDVLYIDKLFIATDQSARPVPVNAVSMLMYHMLRFLSLKC